MKTYKPKLRKCVVCNEHKEKTELIRVVKDKEENVMIDHSGKLNGRGAYICSNKECREKAVKNKMLNRHLKTNIDDKIYQEISTM